MTPQDLAKLHAAAFSATRAWSAAEFERLLKHPGTFSHATDGCFALIRTVSDEAEVLTIATHPDKRRQGLARATLGASETLATSRGSQTMFLEVAEDNAAAISLYFSSGYVQVGRRPGYYLPKDAAPVAALVMRKSIGAT